MAQKARADPQALLRLAALYRTDQARCVEELFGVTLTEDQRDIVNGFFTHRETAARSCHASGKTFAAAACAVLPVLFEQEAICITLSAKEDQLRETLWSEIPRMILRSRIQPLPKPLTLKWELGPKSYLTGGTADNPSTLQGHHAARVYLIVDETAGVENAGIFEALHSLTSGGQSHTLYLMNPTRSAGPEVDLFDKQRVHKIVIDAFRTPNFRHETEDRAITEEELFVMADPDLDWVNPLVPGAEQLISRRYAREIYEDHGLGPSSPWWPRVRGEFPQQDFDSLILREWVERAVKSQEQRDRAEAEAVGYSLIIGIDVAGPGEDSTAWTVRRGPLVLAQGAFREADPQRTAWALKMQLGDYLSEPDVAVNVDSAGIGHYLALYLQSLGLRVSPVNVGHRAYDQERFANSKAEFYWKLRERFQRGDIAGQIGAACHGQLTGILYEENSRGQILIEPKKKARKRGVKSPDEAESLMLAFATTPERRESRQVEYHLGYEHTDEEAPKSRWMTRRRQDRRERIARRLVIR